MSAYYPVSLNVTGRRCVVVGGGQVALRKATSLLECEARVTVVSPEACAGLADLAAQGRIEIVRRAFRNGDLAGVWLAIAATSDSRTNRQVAAEGAKTKTLVNIVDDAEDSDFIAPACVRRGDITIAVSTSGASPALARQIRSRLETQFGEEYAVLARLVQEVRAGLIESGVKPDPEAWQAALRLDELLELIRGGDLELAKARLLAGLKTAARKS